MATPLQIAHDLGLVSPDLPIPPAGGWKLPASPDPTLKVVAELLVELKNKLDAMFAEREAALSAMLEEMRAVLRSRRESSPPAGDMNPAT